MVSLLVATTSDPASINPANALLAMPGWQPGPHFQVQIQKPVFFYDSFFSINLFKCLFFC
jgi:chorismate mutase